MLLKPILLMYVYTLWILLYSLIYYYNESQYSVRLVGHIF